MTIRNTIVALILTALPLAAFTQVIDNTLSYKNINTDTYFRLNYENDVFSATDIYYTQGIHIEVVAPWIKNFPLSKLLVHPDLWSVRYGLGIEHNGYTPTSISSDAILYGDRPFTADLSLKTFVIAIDSSKKQRFTSALSTGIIGPGAGGKQMQESIHRWLNNITPHGWDNQVHNDVVLNYQVDYEKQLIAWENIFSFSADGIARVGTLSDKAGVGAVMMIGYFDSPYDNPQSPIQVKKHFRMYAYEHPEINVIGYDATLQGGLFNRSCPYTIASKDINRFTFQNRFGFVINYQRLYLEYFQSVLSNEFSTGKMHVWGGVQIAFGL